MAVFKCKMCGGTLEVNNETVAVCEYCGTKQTVPSAMDENLQTLFNRANTLRIKSEFDKAEQIYEKILQSDETQAEAYWGLILCKYGIEYVEDPASFKRIPTCHRASYDSIIADDDYKSALENADSSQRAIYEEQAREIDRIQKEILALAQKEETYDVFICYKETDESGQRTQDSVIANDIYYQLTNEGFKVFYAAITLEGKLGQDYEPIIFAALNSAKVMLSIGTKPEYFNAVWVKNEWSRFLKIIKKDRSKLLIPCYRDMDAYELPEEFAHLQAQDMSKIGFINDVVRGIKKIVQADAPKTTVAKETVIAGGNANTAPLLKRAFMFLEDGDWNSSNEYCEKVLDIDPENAQAYLGKLLSELKARKQESLKDCAEPFDHSNNYQKAVRFADEKLKTALIGYIEHINTRNENTRLDGIYTRAKNAMSAANTESAYKEAAHLFESIDEYQDSAVLAQSCYEKAEADRLEKERQAEIARKEAERTAKRNKKIAIITAPIVCAVIAFIIILNTVIIPTQKKNNFIAIYGQEVYDKFGLVDEGEYIKFGKYEQDNNTLNGKEDIEWIVLEVKDGKALVISKYLLDCQPYHNKEGGNITWETCTLRKWLNCDFIDSAFTAGEKAVIPTVTVSADKSPFHNTFAGNATEDKIFLLSVDEADRYFSSDWARRCKVTEYVVAKARNNLFVYYNSGENGYWWLRSPGETANRAAGVSTPGYFDENGSFVSASDFQTVRPAMWIDLNS